MSLFEDDRDRQGTLEVGGAAATTEHRDGEATTGSAAFADDRDHEKGSSAGTQIGLFDETEKIEGQAALGGGQAKRETEGFFDLSGGNGSTEAQPLLSAEERHFSLEEEFGAHDADYRIPEAATYDVSLSPGEAIEGVGAVSQFDASIPDPNGDGTIRRDLAAVRREEQAERSGALSADPNGDSAHAPPAEELFGSSNGGVFGSRRSTETIEFGSREDANQARDQLPGKAVVSERFDRRHKTVELDPESVSDRQLSRIRGIAADSRAAEADQHGQAQLTDAEKREIDFSESNVMRARSVKGIMRGEGVDDWLAYFDPTLTVDEHREIARKAKRDSQGKRMDATTTEAKQIDREARAARRVETEECDHAREGARRGHQEAVEVLVADCGWDRSEAEALRREAERGSISEAEFNRIVEVELRRSSASGRYVRSPVEPATNAPGMRSPTTGWFEGNEFDDPGIGRDPQSGQFVPRSPGGGRL